MADEHSTAAEVWRAIPDLDGYEASSLGRIRSIDRIVNKRTRWGGVSRIFYRGQILKLKKKDNGSGVTYLYFFAGRWLKCWPHVNRCVCLAFHGPAPSEKHQAAHLDGNSINNAAKNLVWATCAENASHKFIHGTAPVGSKNAASKLDERKALEILIRYSAGEKAAAIALDYGVSTATVLAVCRGDIWGHVESEHRSTVKKVLNRNSMHITAFGRTQIVTAWARENGISHTTISNRIKEGWNPEDAVTVRRRKRRGQFFES